MSEKPGTTQVRWRLSHANENAVSYKNANEVGGGGRHTGREYLCSLAYNWMRFPCDQDLAGDWRNLAKSVSYYHISMLFSAW